MLIKAIFRISNNLKGFCKQLKKPYLEAEHSETQFSVSAYRPNPQKVSTACVDRDSSRNHREKRRQQRSL